MADIEQMFYRFLVTKDHRDFLRFFWYRNSDPNEELIEYRMKVHVFGNTPSPAVAMKLRRPSSQQIMADLPADRVVPSPPFTIVGVDVFGPWNIVARRTRGGLAHSKRWAILFSCLTSRAIHIAVIEELSSSAFINALPRFISIRGAVKDFRSDRGTNFAGALDHINVDAIYVESGPVKKFLSTNGAKWTFNPPHASHMAGSWERMIGIARKILDALLLNTKTKELTHEVLCTFMCEVTAIMNSIIQ
ncbi:uncharacterized protein [Magallana gigas]|uniref:uncharacterized protein n=1 Tax=Magallana gigas TaxID=29159 RepID=UPI0033408695